MPSPFDYLKIITEKKENPSNDLNGYSSYIMNKIFSCSKEFCLLAVEANKYGGLDSKQNFDLYNNVISKGKYYIQYNAKKVKEEELINYVTKYYSINITLAKEYIKLLSKQEQDDIMEIYEPKPQHQQKIKNTKKKE